MAGQSLPQHNVVDFERQLRGFKRFERPKPHIFEGFVTAQQLQNGFGLHTLNATARHSFEVDAYRTPGAVIHCFLEGSAEAYLDGKPMNLGRNPGDPVKMVLTSVDETHSFVRRSQPDEYVRKISIQMSPAWLDQNGLTLPDEPSGEAMQRTEWVANSSEVQLLEQLAMTSDFVSPVARLQAESMSLGLVARCFGDLDDTTGTSHLTEREQSQLHRVEELARQPGPLPSLQDLATEGGLSQSGLRRLIQTTYGRAPLAHVRMLRLELAHAALKEERLSVEQAAELAGYGSAANFATAFRRAFGMSPSYIRRTYRPL